MSDTNLEGIKRFDDLVKELSNLAVIFLDNGFDTLIESLDLTKTGITLFQQELVDIGKGDIIFSKKYFDIA
jgi:cystathionine beta-lyase family protein involved in aluminum resistance|tara:strand:- start:18068 stop:18280 length:213 start_codon:yes stop_codon:yes gene_type:complete